MVTRVFCVADLDQLGSVVLGIALAPVVRVGGQEHERSFGPPFLDHVGAGGDGRVREGLLLAARLDVFLGDDARY